MDLRLQIHQSFEGLECCLHWKDAPNPGGSENHFGLFTIDGKAKYALWDLVDESIFKGLGRGKNPITKTYNGNKDSLLLEVHVPPFKKNNNTL